MTNDFPPRRGGIESFVASLCERLPADQVVVLTARMTGAGRVDAGLPFPVVRAPARNLLPTPGLARVAAATARTHGCDRVVFGAAAPLGLLGPTLRAAGVTRSIALTHGHELSWAAVPGPRAALRRIARDADVLTFVSEFCGARLAAALGADVARRMVRLSPGVDHGAFAPGASVPGVPTLRKRLEIAAERPLVVAPSRLVARKGHDVLVRAWPLVLRRQSDAVLAIVGDGPAHRRLVRLVRAQSLGASVRFLPGLDHSEMPTVYADAQVMALPCRTRWRGLEPEALGIVFLEAAAAGLPVVVGRSGGTPETLRDGVTGHLVDPRSVTEVADRIAGLLDDPDGARAMGAAGRAMVVERFDADAAASRLAGLLHL